MILAAYDRGYSMVELRHKKLLALDPNGAAGSATEFTISGLDGKKLQMASLLGKVVVLDFWATWCEPCRGQHPIYEEVKKRYGTGTDVVFLPLTPTKTTPWCSRFSNLKCGTSTCISTTD